MVLTPRNAACPALPSLSAGTGTQALHSQCAALGLLLPAGTSTCRSLYSLATCSAEQPSCLGAHWSAGEWGPCSAACGGGSQERPVTCVADAEPVAESACAGLPRPAPQRVCNSSPCHARTWLLSGWSACGASATRTRSAACLTELGQAADDCLGSPATVESCATTPPPLPASSCASGGLNGPASPPACLPAGLHYATHMPLQ